MLWIPVLKLHDISISKFFWKNCRCWIILCLPDYIISITSMMKLYTCTRMMSNIGYRNDDDKVKRNAVFQDFFFGGGGDEWLFYHRAMGFLSPQVLGELYKASASMTQCRLFSLQPLSCILISPERTSEHSNIWSRLINDEPHPLTHLEL